MGMRGLMSTAASEGDNGGFPECRVATATRPCGRNLPALSATSGVRSKAGNMVRGGVDCVLPGQPLPGLPSFMVELMAGVARYESIVPMDEVAPR
jgi:hypothetical protein